jgi:hypothetical protein
MGVVIVISRSALVLITTWAVFAGATLGALLVWWVR